MMRERIYRLVTGGLLVALAAAIVGVAVIAVAPVELTAPYTEFYVLNTEGRGGTYPSNLSVGEQGTVVLGVENHEHRNMTYTIVLKTTTGVINSRTIQVSNGAHWRHPVSFVFDAPGRHQLEFFLYKGSAPTSDPYRRLYLYIDVD